MSNRSRIVLGSLGGAFAIHLAALSCSGNYSVVGSRDRDATIADGGVTPEHDGGLVDVLASALDAVGDAVRDAATKVVDGEVRDAHAGGGTVIEVACDQESTTTASQISDAGTSPYVSVGTTFFGIVPGVAVVPRMAPQVTAYTCDPETFGPTSTCSAGYRCETTGATLPSATCTTALPYVAGDGRLVVSCGSRSSITSGGTTVTFGTRYRRAYVRVD